MEGRHQISTAISDLFLSLISLHASHRLHEDTVPASLAFFIHSFAAALGVLHFGVFPRYAYLTKTHKYFSWLGNVLSCPLIAMSFCKHEEFNRLGNFFLALGISSIVVCSFMRTEFKEQIAQLLSTTSMVTVLLLSLYKFKPYGIIGTLLYSVAGLAVGVNGTCSRVNIPCVDVFHYVLCLGNLSLMLALVNKTTLVYYRPSLMSS